MLTGVLVSSDSRIERFSSARGQSTDQSPPSPPCTCAEDDPAELKRPAVEVFGRRVCAGRVSSRNGRAARTRPTP